jgi:L-malate glycosyltransferase
MRVTVIGRTYLLRINRDKWRYLPPGMDIALITPPRVKQTMTTHAVELSECWPHTVAPAWNTGKLTSFAYNPLSLYRALRANRPQLVQIDEEPVSFAILEVLLLKRWLRYRVVFFTWENHEPRYRFISHVMRWLALQMADGAIAGNTEAMLRLKQAGFRGALAVIPQLGVDTAQFSPQPVQDMRRTLGLKGFTVGYVGRLVPEKGLLGLLEALCRVQGDWSWLIVGSGPLEATLMQRARELGVAERIAWAGVVSHAEVPHYLNAMDALVLPSLTTAQWKEQFGHVLIEGMACGVPVIGSDSGAIPEVIGDAGLVFPEDQIKALAAHLQLLYDDIDLRATLGRRGRDRVLEHFTNKHIAALTADFWQEVVACE